MSIRIRHHLIVLSTVWAQCVVKNFCGWDTGGSVKHLTVDLRSGLDLRDVNSSPALGSMLRVEPTKKRKNIWVIKSV